MPKFVCLLTVTIFTNCSKINYSVEAVNSSIYQIACGISTFQIILGIHDKVLGSEPGTSYIFPLHHSQCYH